MALLRRAHSAGVPVGEQEALDAATLAGGPPGQPDRVLRGLVADGLAVRDDRGRIHLPGSLPPDEGVPVDTA